MINEKKDKVYSDFAILMILNAVVQNKLAVILSDLKVEGVIEF